MLTRLAANAPVGSGPVTGRQRLVALLLTAVLLGVATLVWPATPAHAACTDEEWKNAKDPASIANCVKQLAPANGGTTCAEPPAPGAPDSGMAGWFVTRPESSKKPGTQGTYSTYGYAGYTFDRYDVGCSPGIANPGSTMATTVANGEMMIATSIIGASNAFRERAWNPATMWGWADPLVEKATKAVYNKVFRVFGAITLVVVGLYLIWRSRQSDMSDALTTAGWAVFVMVLVTALFAYPVWASKLADGTLIQSLGVVHDAIGPPAKDISPCPPRRPGEAPDLSRCKDNRPPAVRASDTATDSVLYRNWLRGVLGSSTSKTATKYGPALYDAKALTWEELERIRKNPSDTQVRQKIISTKNNQWRQLAAQIQKEDPEAYEYLAGKKGMEQVGAGAIAMIAAFFFSFFDIAASVLIILGFLIFRWAVVAAPIVGTIAIMRPAGGGLKRIGNAVVAAIFNIIVFGAGAAVYLFAVDLIMTTPSLAGWLQVVLIALCGVVGWMLLRPYRRLTQLGGKDSMAEVTSIGSWHRRFFGDLKQVALTAGGTYLGDVEALDEHEKKKQKEQQRAEAPRRHRPESEPDRIPDAQPVTVSRPSDDVRDEPAPAPPAGERRHETEHARMFGDGQTVYVDDDGVLYAEPETINGQQVYVVHRDHANH